MTANASAPVSDGAQPMALVRISDGQGGYRHVFRPVPPEQPKKKRKTRHTPDPIDANPDSAAKQLQQYIERRERLEEEKAGIADDIRDVNAEAKAMGFDVKAITAIIAMRKMNPDMRREAEAILDTYKTALGIA